MEKMPSTRQLKVAEQIRQILSEFLIKEDLYDTAINQADISVTNVKVNADLSLAKVYIHTLLNTADIIPLLMQHKSQFRKYLGHKISLKTVPDLIFLWDDSFEERNKIDALFNDEKVIQDLKK